MAGRGTMWKWWCWTSVHSLSSITEKQQGCKPSSCWHCRQQLRDPVGLLPQVFNSPLSRWLEIVKWLLWLQCRRSPLTAVRFQQSLIDQQWCQSLLRNLSISGFASRSPSEHGFPGSWSSTGAEGLPETATPESVFCTVVLHAGG